MEGEGGVPLEVQRSPKSARIGIVQSMHVPVPLLFTQTLNPNLEPQTL